jgi:hypothetical protein
MNPRKLDTHNPEAADLQQLKENLLVGILTMSGIGISPNEWRSWRPTKVVAGDIAGIEQTVRCFATDGNLGIFNTSVQTTNLGTWFVGHVRDFTWSDANGNPKKGCPPSLFAKDGTGKAKSTGKAKPKKKSRLEKLTELLGL